IIETPVQPVGPSCGGGPGGRGGGACGCLSCVAGIFQYETISCSNCTDSHVVCFGYNCEESQADSLLSVEPDVGLDLTTLRSQPEPKPRGAPRNDLNNS
uniref:Uncharacterized protein n=1 Tax=Ursus maritimus TaxID=29073 RepID=A0A452TIU4_URSMA